MILKSNVLNGLVEIFSRTLIVSGAMIGLTQNNSVFTTPIVGVITTVLLMLWVLKGTGIEPFSDKKEFGLEE